MKYTETLEKAKAWTPPTELHTRFKEFMVEQLTESIYWDCEDSTPEEFSTREEFERKTIDDVKNVIDYLEKNIEEELKRCVDSNKWLVELLEST